MDIYTDAISIVPLSSSLSWSTLPADMLALLLPSQQTEDSVLILVKLPDQKLVGKRSKQASRFASCRKSNHHSPKSTCINCSLVYLIYDHIYRLRLDTRAPAVNVPRQARCTQVPEPSSIPPPRRSHPAAGWLSAAPLASTGASIFPSVLQHSPCLWEKALKGIMVLQ